jgi:thiol-disulfide isomerase/thioredoxin
MFKKISFTIAVLLFLIFPLCPLYSNTGLRLVFLFTPKCPHCRATIPFMNDLSEKYIVEGIIFGNGDIPEVKFPLTKGTKDMAERFGLKKVPYLVVLENGRQRLAVSGRRDIMDMEVILRGISQGALLPSEIKDGGAKEFVLTGWLIHRGEYFKKDSGFFITDRKTSIEVLPWLPLEAVKSPFKAKRPKTMSDLIGRPLILKGRLDARDRFIVKEEIE